MAHVTLINPPMVTQRGDFFGTGIPYMPLDAVYVATYLKKKKHRVHLIDAFGEGALHTRRTKTHFIQGLQAHEVAQRMRKKTDLIIIYAGRLFKHDEVMRLVEEMKQFGAPIAILENTQAVTAYSLRRVAQVFFDAGVDYLITGEPELRIEELLEQMKGKMPIAVEGVLTKKNQKLPEKKTYLKDLDQIPPPDWSLIPLENYWKLGVAHAPLTSKKYLPLQTSRGCPYVCTFCVVPDTNERTWRYHSPKYVVDEMERNVKKFGVREFHLEDLNPGILKKRIHGICEEIIKRKLDVSWKICSGTKIEHLTEESIALMAKAGCSYISISPESGSKKILQKMEKYFDHDYAVRMVRAMHTHGITSQACFVLGYPGETKKDLKDTSTYIRELTKAGVDEIALFILTPTPGSKVYTKMRAPKDLAKMTFSPTWRKDYDKYVQVRKKLYSQFALDKLAYHPLKTIRQPLHMLTRRFHTKMEMTPYRIFRTALRAVLAKKA